MTKKIGLDCGHGLNTAGKQTPDGIKEWTLNDKVRDKVVALLSDYDCEIIHTDNNEGNTDESLASRVNAYLNKGVAAFVSIHHNAFTGNWNNATGVEVFTDKNPTNADLQLASCIYGRLVDYTGLKGRGIKKEDWWVINQDRIPAVLVEGGFMDGSNDYKVITSEAGQTAYAKAVAEGLIEFLGLEKKAAVTDTNIGGKKTVDELAREVIAGLHGTGHENRKASLLKQGYNNYEEVRARVNELFGVKTTPATPSVSYFKKYTGTSGSIVTALNSIGENSAFAYRSKIAKANGINGYTGTASQNTNLVSLLKQGKLIKP